MEKVTYVWKIKLSRPWTFGNDSCRLGVISHLYWWSNSEVFVAFSGQIHRWIHRIHKWRTRGKILVPSHESEALKDKQKLQMKTFTELAECLTRITPKISFYGRVFKYNFVGCLVLICCLQSKGTRISSRKQDDFVGFRSIRSSTSGRWLEKSGKHVGPNFTLKPNTKASSLQFCKTEIKTDIGGGEALWCRLKAYFFC